MLKKEKRGIYSKRGLNVKDKKAAEEVLSFIIYAIFALIIFIALLFFVRNSAGGDLLKEQILTKQVALLIDAAKPGTEIIINKENFLVQIIEKKVIAKAKPANFGYVYDFFSPYIIETETKGTTLKIKVSE